MSDITIESALTEIRQMLPHRDIQISQSGWSWQYPSKHFQDGYKTKIEVGFFEKFEADTLDEAMDQVRAWVRERELKGGERG